MADQQYTDLAKPDDVGTPKFEEADAKRNYDVTAENSTYEVAGPGQVIQKLGKIE